MVEYCHSKATDGGAEMTIESCVVRIIAAAANQVGRNAFVVALNKFRSKQVDVGAGYYHLVSAMPNTQKGNEK